ncbi:YeaC family protein [Psychromonas antarctica]|jgi:uncharacterized protein YeaC (DUF1315 family)|uniref:YeaC family protein n=1 Tax=Psychromonas antarctica TaxID=67573 RepID=UPI001EE889EF|nr:DUF1315 family protein [Psychromonas antarctica]MCG6202093.1 DUF1315 family protein [Psychromonas antarctica]
MSNLTEYAKNISPVLYEQLKQAIETSKWLDGNSLSEQQKTHCLQLVMAYQSLFNDHPDHFSIAKGGDIYMQNKKELKNKFSHVDIHFLDL